MERSYKVFTPFYQKGCLMYGDTPRAPLPKPKSTNNIISLQENKDVKILNLLPKYKWDKKLENCWSIGEESSLSKFNMFVEKWIKGL